MFTMGCSNVRAYRDDSERAVIVEVMDRTGIPMNKNPGNTEPGFGRDTNQARYMGWVQVSGMIVQLHERYNSETVEVVGFGHGATPIVTFCHN